MVARMVSIVIAVCFIGHWPVLLPADESLSKSAAQRSLKKAVSFFRQDVSVSGGYLWRYSHDLSKREGENLAAKSTAWVQPPGTPSVGEALLKAFERTKDGFYLAAARETARALVRGQLQSGGWDYRIEFDPRRRKKYAYRVDGPAGGKRNVTTLDDDNTQSALRFLMRIDRALEFKDRQIHESVEFALASLLKAQYPNGAWPQRFSKPPDPKKFPLRKAGYPKSWPRTYPKQDYRSYYTFNDDTIADMIATMFAAADVYDDDRYRQSAERGGGFILLAQMPDPQPAWAQQYDAEMHPAWARRFEPASITGGESQGVLRTLLFLYRQTGKKKFLEPIPRAVAYLKKSQLKDGRLARFYELKTNRPLYFTKRYELTYRSDDMPTHYGFIVGSSLNSIEAEYKRLLKTPLTKLKPARRAPTYRMSAALASQAKAAVGQLDQRGAWVEDGKLRAQSDGDRTTRIIDCRTFSRNVEILSRFIAASK